MDDVPTVHRAADRHRLRSRRALWVSVTVVVLTLLIGVIAGDRIVDTIIERRITSALHPDGDAQVDVVGFPVLTQLATGRLHEVQIHADRTDYAGITFAAVNARLFDVPVDTSRPVGTVDASAVIPIEALDALAAQHSDLPEGTHFATTDGHLTLTGSLLGQELHIGIEPQAAGRRVTVAVTNIGLGSADIDVSMLPGVLTSAISDITINLDALPAGLELTDVSPDEKGLAIHLHGSGVMLDQ